MATKTNSIKDQKTLTDRELIIFNSELDRKRKSTATAYILYLFLGAFGVHKFYLGQPIKGISYIFMLLGGLSFLATPALNPSAMTDASTVSSLGAISLLGLGLNMLIDLFTIPRQIKKQEDRVRNDLLTQLVNNN